MAMEYNATLKEKYAAHPQVKRIARHRQVPKHIYHERNQQLESRKKLKRKYDIFISKKLYVKILIIFIYIFREENIRRHSKKNSIPYVPEREKIVISEDV